MGFKEVHCHSVGFYQINPPEEERTHGFTCTSDSSVHVKHSIILFLVDIFLLLFHRYIKLITNVINSIDRQAVERMKTRNSLKKIRPKMFAK